MNRLLSGSSQTLKLKAGVWLASSPACLWSLKSPERSQFSDTALTKRSVRRPSPKRHPFPVWFPQQDQWLKLFCWGLGLQSSLQGCRLCWESFLAFHPYLIWWKKIYSIAFTGLYVQKGLRFASSAASSKKVERTSKQPCKWKSDRS